MLTETDDNSAPVSLTFNTADLSNILLLRLITLAESKAFAQPGEYTSVLKQEALPDKSHSFQDSNTQTIVEKDTARAQGCCSAFDQTLAVGCLKKTRPSKTIAQTIKYERNLLAHGASLSLGETLACFKVNALLKSREKSRKYQDQRHVDVISWIEILECARRKSKSATSTTVEVRPAPSRLQTQSRIFLTGPKPLSVEKTCWHILRDWQRALRMSRETSKGTVQGFCCTALLVSAKRQSFEN